MQVELKKHEQICDQLDDAFERVPITAGWFRCVARTRGGFIYRRALASMAGLLTDHETA